MIGADKSTKLWMPPRNANVVLNGQKMISTENGISLDIGSKKQRSLTPLVHKKLPFLYHILTVGLKVINLIPWVQEPCVFFNC